MAICLTRFWFYVLLKISIVQRKCGCCSGFFTALLWVNILIKDLAAFYSNDIFVAYFTLTMYDNVLQESPGQERFGGRVFRDHCRDGSSAGGRSKRGAAPISGSPAPYINPSIWRQRSVPWRVWLNTQGPEVVSRPLGGFPGNDFTGRGSSISTSIIAGYFHTSAETHSPIGTPEGESKSKPTSCTNPPRQRYIAPPPSPPYPHPPSLVGVGPAPSPSLSSLTLFHRGESHGAVCTLISKRAHPHPHLQMGPSPSTSRGSRLVGGKTFCDGSRPDSKSGTTLIWSVCTSGVDWLKVRSWWWTQRSPTTSSPHLHRRQRQLVHGWRDQTDFKLSNFQKYFGPANLS